MDGFAKGSSRGGENESAARRPERIAFDALRALSKGEWAALLAGGAETAAPWIASAARYGLVEAQLVLGQMLLDGRGIRRDPTSAARWFAAAADAGCVEAMNMLGRCHEMGWGVRQDDAAAADWYSRAAEQGLDWAQYNLANLTLRGRGVAKDRAKALWLYLRAADQGHAKSMNMVGRYFEEGWEVARDAGAALEWYRRAARRRRLPRSIQPGLHARANRPDRGGGGLAGCRGARRNGGPALHRVRRAVGVRGTRAARRGRTCRREIGVIAQLARDADRVIFAEGDVSDALKG